MFTFFTIYYLLPVKWRLWHGYVEHAIRDLERIIAQLQRRRENGLCAGRLHALGSQLLTHICSNRSAIINYEAHYRAGLRVATTLAQSAVNLLVAKRIVKKQQMRWSQHGVRRRALPATPEALSLRQFKQ
jgi:hypothetical protein